MKNYTFSAPCKVRPYEIPNGIMRFHGMQHGNKAKYHCNTGYKLLQGPSEGGEIDKGGGSRHNAQPDFAFRTCLFGRWEGATPKCTKGKSEALEMLTPGTNARWIGGHVNLL